MHESKPNSSTATWHFSSEPAMPTTRSAPMMRAIWPATLPVPPAAALTTTVSPSCGAPISMPSIAVTPG